jgi:hypothetical protein
MLFYDFSNAVSSDLGREIGLKSQEDNLLFTLVVFVYNQGRT